MMWAWHDANAVRSEIGVPSRITVTQSSDPSVRNTVVAPIRVVREHEEVCVRDSMPHYIHGIAEILLVRHVQRFMTDVIPASDLHAYGGGINGVR
jgi:hypothetical protein